MLVINIFHKWPLNKKKMAQKLKKIQIQSIIEMLNFLSFLTKDLFLKVWKYLFTMEFTFYSIHDQTCTLKIQKYKAEKIWPAVKLKLSDLIN